MKPIIQKYRLGDFREMMTKKKTELPNLLDTTISMLPQIEYLHFEVVDGFAWIWILTNTEYNPVQKRFVILPTGRDITEFKLEQLKFIDTFNYKEFNQLWHLFEVI